MVQGHKPDGLLASDLDGTLIPDGGGPHAAASRFRTCVARFPRLGLAYVTGRHFELALEGIRAARLPLPRFLVCDVGTSLRERVDGAWEFDHGYRERMREAAGDAEAAGIDTRLADLPGLALQEDEKQAEFKRSFYFDPGLAEDDVESRARERLEGWPVRVVVSREEATGRGLLDVLPEGVAKDTAVRWLIDRFGLAPDRVLFAGDSGNDLVALLAGWNAVLVGNAPDAVRRRVREEAKRRGLAERVLLAEGPVVQGVLEGCAHFGLCGR